VLGPPSQAENGASRQFLIEQTNAQNMAHDAQLAHKRVEGVQRTGYFREATGAKRSFNPQYGEKLKLEEVIPGGQYIKGSDDNLHLLKRTIPVHQNSGEPQGRLTSARQYLHDTLRDLAEDLHADLVGHPRTLERVGESLLPKLKNRGAKLTVRDFIRKYTDLFRLAGDREVVHALVLSHPHRAKNKPVEVSPVVNQPRPNVQVGGSSSSNQPPQDRSAMLASHFRGALEYQPKTTPEERARQKAEREAKAAEAQAQRDAAKKKRDDKAAADLTAKMQRQLAQMVKRNR
jgi:hypothetical protein